MRKIDQTSRFNDKNQCFQAIYKKKFCLYVYKDATLLAFFRWFWIVQLFSAFKGLVKTEMFLLQGLLLPYKHHTRFGRILLSEMLPSVKLVGFQGACHEANMHVSQNLQLSQSESTTRPLNQIVYLKTMHYSNGTVPTTWPLESPSCKVERQTFEKRSGLKFSQDNNVAPTWKQMA